MMRAAVFFVLAAAAYGGPFSAAASDVLVLTDATIDAAIADHEVILIEFYAPWCGHCKKLEPEYDSAAASLKKDAPNAKLAKVDATENKASSAKYKVEGFPTLKLFNRGQMSDYSGGREAADILAYMIKKSGPPAAAIASADDKEALMAGNGRSVLGYFADLESSQAAAFLSMAASMDTMDFGITTDSSLVGGLAAKGDAIALYKTFDEGKNEMAVTSDTTSAEMEAFVSKYALRLVTIFTPETAPEIFGGTVKRHLLMFMKEGADYYESNLAMLEETAMKRRGEVLHVAVPSTETRVMEYFGFDEDILPKVVLADMEGGAMKKYLYEGSITSAGLEAFETDFFDGKLSPSLKSEDVDDEDDKEDVKVIKGKSFASKVLDNDKNVFVKFYAPWCGHCKSLAPKWEALAEKYADNESIVISKFDATANEIDVEGVNVEGFPTLIWFPTGAKEKPLVYGGGRELDDLVKFVEKETTAGAKIKGDEL